jgi:hypothetical protein
LVALLAVFALSPGTAPLNAGPKQQQGIVRDWFGHQLPLADVSAWEGRAAIPKGECPQFDKQLAATRTDAHGQFSISVEREAYQAVFCAQGYFPRVETQTDAQQHDRVMPFPVTLYPRGPDAGTFREAVVERVRSFASDIRYLAQSKSDAFSEAIGQLRGSRPEGDTAGLEMFLENTAARAKGNAPPR